ncbi:hypothetical protein VTO42DRAFT_4198 [Malbranchea cinnamomea]
MLGLRQPPEKLNDQPPLLTFDFLIASPSRYGTDKLLQWFTYPRPGLAYIGVLSGKGILFLYDISHRFPLKRKRLEMVKPLVFNFDFELNLRDVSQVIHYWGGDDGKCM